MTELDDTKRALVEAMMQVRETIDIIVEGAKGLKVQMEADGWSPTAAESVAMEMTSMLIRKMGE